MFRASGTTNRRGRRCLQCASAGVPPFFALPALVYNVNVKDVMRKDYGDMLNFEESDSFDLPDFSITFLGETKVKKEDYVNEFFVYYDYILVEFDVILL